jgi:predicted AlkP superfamily pyrophosphatase or phosphodiesterase
MKRAALLSSCAMIAFATGAAAAPTPSRPKLVVVLAVDQMRADYVDLYGAGWKHGLHTLFEQGAVFTKARYPFLSTVTCAGHATIGTGAYPHRHGMVLNSWWDRSQQRMTECTADPASPLVRYGDSTGTQGDSANNLLVPTLADEMKTQLRPAPRVVSFSIKARSAIGLAGHKPDLVTWWEGGGWVTARAFAPQPNPVVVRLLKASPVDKALATPWQRLLPAGAYKYEDDVPQERADAPWTRTFPKPLQAVAQPGSSRPPAKYGLWERSPLTDEELGRLARGVLAEMKLGRGKGTEFLGVSFSALDMVGHAYGPRSHEVQDGLARLDKVVGDLLAALDKQVGRGNYVIGLSADHGVAEIPERLRAEGKDAGRVSMSEVSTHLNAALVTELGPGKHVATVSYTDIYLAPGVLDRLKARPGAIDRALEAVRAVKGVVAAYSTDQLRDAARITDPAQRAAALSHYPARSGDFILVPRVNWLTSSGGGTTHGTHHDYDQHVPLVFYGAGIRPGRYDGPASPADLAPTLARLIGVRMSHAEGRALEEALALHSAGPVKPAKPVKGRRPERR